MAEARLELELGTHGASLAVIADRLKEMNDAQVKDIFRRALEDAAGPYPDRVRARIMAIPVTQAKTTFLRARIAACVTETSFEDTRSAGVSIWVDPFRIRPDYVTLPLYMEGVSDSPRGDYSRWRHPVFGRREDPWVQQDAHPYFYGPLEPLAGDARDALEDALDGITDDLSGR